MFKDKWIITKKIPVKNAPGSFNYTIVPIDTYGAGEGDYEMWCEKIYSKQNLDMGTCTNEELTPLQEYYRYRNIDIATVECVTLNAFTPGVKRWHFFGRRFGEFSFLMDAKEAPFKVKRGNQLVIQRTYDTSYMDTDEDEEDYYDDYDDDDEDDEYTRPEIVGIPTFRPIYNITTKRKTAYFPNPVREKSKSNFGDCDKAIVLGITPTNLDCDMQKHMVVNSKKFGMISCMADEYSPEFQIEAGDKLLIEQYFDRNLREIAYKILSNKTIDDMRKDFLVKRK